MKLIANDIYLNYLPGGKVAVSFKEMTELIDYAIDYAIKVGADV